MFMAKTLLGPQAFIYPMPVLLAGANVDGKPNFMPVAWCGIADGSPPTLTIALAHSRHTYIGIKQNMTFSLNTPSPDLVKETDYCGLRHGFKVDKVEVCQFKVFYGKLGNAPLIEQCPMNLECKVMHVLDVGSHALIVAKIEETHVSEECLTDGKPDIDKIRPLTFITTPYIHYQALGEVVAKAYSIGEELKEREKG
jgi:flavin reductase (DIM6/NTAB) family NADH-FMN oxidoreductase RutF